MWHERLGLSVDEIAFQYDLELPEIYAALSYYFDHRERIDRDIRDGEERVGKMERETRSKLRETEGGSWRLRSATTSTRTYRWR